MFCDEFKCQEDYYLSELDKSHVTIQLLYENLLNKEAKWVEVHFKIKWDWYAEKMRSHILKTRNPGEVMEVDYGVKSCALLLMMAKK